MLRVMFLRLVHYAIALGEFAFNILRFLPYYDFIFAKKQLASNVETDSKKLRKLPLHVGLIIAENEFSLTDLANMVVWSVTMGISYISIYDMNGEIKRNNQSLKKAVEQSRKEMQCEKAQDSHELHIFTYSPCFTETLTVGKGTKKASIHLLSAEDGCQLLVQVARNLCHQVAAHHKLVSDISPVTISSMINETHQFPDPDLVLKFGATNCLMGYLPWQIRLSEIISVPSHKGLTYQGFVASLGAYASTEQRYGK